MEVGFPWVKGLPLQVHGGFPSKLVYPPQWHGGSHWGGRCALYFALLLLKATRDRPCADMVKEYGGPSVWIHPHRPGVFCIPPPVPGLLCHYSATAYDTGRQTFLAEVGTGLKRLLSDRKYVQVACKARLSRILMA